MIKLFGKYLCVQRQGQSVRMILRIVDVTQDILKEYVVGYYQGRIKCLKHIMKTGLSTVEIIILFPPWIRSYLSDILFCPGNTCTVLQTGDEKCCVGDTRVFCSTLRLYGRKSYLRACQLHFYETLHSVMLLHV